MIRLLLLLLAGGAIALGAAWLADHDGVFLLTMNGYELRTSAGFGVFLCVAAAIVLLLALRLILLLWHGPSRFGAFFSARRARNAYQALSTGLIAAAAGDAQEAAHQAKRSGLLLDTEPLALLLKAQAAELSGETAERDAAYQAMLASPATEMLGLRGLSARALETHDDARALELLTRARALKPWAAWTFDALFDVHLRRREWAQAQALVTQACRAKTLTPEIAERKRGELRAAETREADRAGWLSAIGRAPDL